MTSTRTVRLNPFEIRAGLLRLEDRTVTSRRGLNPFEIRAGLLLFVSGMASQCRSS